jgi:CRISPR-associated exonuclease Cas4
MRAVQGGAPNEDDLLPISALQHLVFCERQCALIHIEQAWAENPFTLEGEHLHESADVPGLESRGGLRIARGLHLRSFRLGLSGIADVVEFQRCEGDAHEGAALPGIKGRWTPYPVEYKRGRKRYHRANEVQLCAQALCLEEMLETPVPKGALYYGKSRRRLEVEFSEELREFTESACERLRSLLAAGRTPPAVREKKCRDCSLLGICQPDVIGRSVSTYLKRSLGLDLVGGERS